MWEKGGLVVAISMIVHATLLERERRLGTAGGEEMKERWERSEETILSVPNI
jgi:hypothetical protein